MPTSSERGVRSAQIGMLVNTTLAVVKLVAGVVGNAYALIADAVESSADIFSSLVVWRGLRIASREADEAYPFGYGKAEPLAAAVVAIMLLGAALGIAVEAIREIRTPHHSPAPFTLVVLIVVVLVKETLFRRVLAVGHEVGSTAVKADAWHHRSDAITSVAAFIGISVALIGGPGWEMADDWAALFAALVIVVNAVRLLRPAIDDIMDKSPGAALEEKIARAALATDDVRAIEKLRTRKVGLGYQVDLHVQADPAMSLHAAHILSGRVKSAIRAAVPEVQVVLIHMEPHEP
ncbi:MAG TPA: cation diffusion facilitator family transporter [Gemmatimonadales bacterium]|nr:cation diffusion facilitator family transporter [Gemmatimonadales bacterium]